MLWFRTPGLKDRMLALEDFLNKFSSARSILSESDSWKDFHATLDDHRIKISVDIRILETEYSKSGQSHDRIETIESYFKDLEGAFETVGKCKTYDEAHTSCN